MPWALAAPRTTCGALAGTFLSLARMRAWKAATSTASLNTAVDHGAKDVAERLVQRPGLVVAVPQAGGVLGHAVGQLVGGHIDVEGHLLEDDAVAVAEHHPHAVPEGVGEADAEVDVA